MICKLSRLVVCSCILVSGLAVSLAAQPAEELLPSTTKGLFIVANLSTLEDHFNASEFGKLSNDPTMKAFVDDFRAQIHKNGARKLEKLGLTLEELEGVPGGEIALATTFQAASKERGTLAVASQILLVDVTGKNKQATALLSKIDANLKKQGAKQTSAANSPITVFTLPREEGERQDRIAAYFLDGDLLAAADDVNVLTEIRKAVGKGRGDSIKTLVAYDKVMSRCKSEAGSLAPDFRWYVDPFGFIDARHLQMPAALRRAGPDKATIFRKQGFSAVQAMGGYVNFKTEKYEFLHRTAIYAPRDPAAKGNDKYALAANMLSFSNSANLAPEKFIPRDLANYTTFNCDLLKAFDSSESLVDAVVGEKGVFRDIIAGIRDDAKGPMVDLRKEIISKLGQRCTVVADYVTPIDAKCERKAFIVEIPAANVATVGKAIDRLFGRDKDVRIHNYQGIKIYEIIEPGSGVQATPASLSMPTIQMGGTNFTPVQHADLKRPVNDDNGRLLKNAAICLVNNRLYLASHVEFLKKLTNELPPENQLTGADDLNLVNQELAALGAKECSFRIFTRTDEAYRPTYELIRMGKMPESETMFASMLNSMFDEGKEGVLRPQRIDGKNLPEYDMARRYFGPAGHYITTETDGWYASGFTIGNNAKK